MLVVDDVCPRSACLALDQGASWDFGQDSNASLQALDAKRIIAVEDWLTSSLSANGYYPLRHRTRHAADGAWTQKQGDGSFSDVTSGIADTAAAFSLAGNFNNGGSLIIGRRDPFIGVEVLIDDGTGGGVYNADPDIKLAVDYWNGRWAAAPGFAPPAGPRPADAQADAGGDGTNYKGRTLAKGGRLTWTRLSDWRDRRFSGTDGVWVFAVRIRIIAADADPDPAVSDERRDPPDVRTFGIFPVRQSRLTTAAAYYALALLYNEADTAARGTWMEKAEKFFIRADDMLRRAMPRLGDEFDAEGVGNLDRASRDIGFRRVSTVDRG